jgi:ribonuclease HI
MKTLEVYSDGSGTTKDKSAGYGYVLVCDGEKFSEGSGTLIGTNNDAETAAAIEGLKAAYKLVFPEINVLGSFEVRDIVPPEVVLVSDSQIVLGWADGTYGFKQQDKIEQYNLLRKLMLRLNVKTRWVKGHAGDVHNSRCDKLANTARRSQLPPKPEKPRKAEAVKREFRWNRPQPPDELRCTAGDKERVGNPRIYTNKSVFEAMCRMVTELAELEEARKR